MRVEGGRHTTLTPDTERWLKRCANALATECRQRGARGAVGLANDREGQRRRQPEHGRHAQAPDAGAQRRTQGRGHHGTVRSPLGSSCSAVTGQPMRKCDCWHEPVAFCTSAENKRCFGAEELQLVLGFLSVFCDSKALLHPIGSCITASTLSYQQQPSACAVSVGLLVRLRLDRQHRQHADDSWCAPRRMEREVCGGRLWYPDCQAANSDLPKALPENFADAGATAQAFV